MTDTTDPSAAGRAAVGRLAIEVAMLREKSLKGFALSTTSGAAIAVAMPPLHSIQHQQAVIASGHLLGMLRAGHST